MGKRTALLDQLLNCINVLLTDTLSSKNGSFKNHKKFEFLDVLLKKTRNQNEMFPKLTI